MYRPLSATRTRRCEIRPCLRIFSASNAATRSAPVLAWRDGGNLCVCRAGRCGHRPLRLFIGNRCVGAASRTTRAGLALQLLRSCHCEPVTDVTGVAIRTPLRRAALAGREKTSASTVRRDVGIAPYGYFEGWCRRADVGSGPYGAFNDRCA